MNSMNRTITLVVSLFVCIALGGRLLARGAGLPALVGFFFGALALGMTLASYVYRRAHEAPGG